MTRARIVSIAGIAAAALVTISVNVFAYTPTTAQSLAEDTCHEHGVRLGSLTWELCLSHVTRAYEWGETSLAAQLAHAAGQADESCLDRGLRPQTAPFNACISREIDAQSELLILGDDRSGVNVAAKP
jgi:hypothetical protein